MLNSKIAFVALTVLSHYFTAVTAVPLPEPGILDDIVNGVSNLFSSNFVQGLLNQDSGLATSKSYPSTISGSGFFLSVSV